MPKSNVVDEYEQTIKNGLIFVVHQIIIIIKINVNNHKENLEILLELT